MDGSVLLTCAAAALLLAGLAYAFMQLLGLALLCFKAGALLLKGVIELCIDAVQNWLQAKKVNHTDYGKIVAQKLATGNYRVVAGVFSISNCQLASNTWENTQLDADMRRRLAESNGTLIMNLG